MKKPFGHIVFTFLVLIAVAIGCRKEEVITDNEKEVPKATPYDLEIPFFFPPMEIPEDNPMTVEGIDLGRHLFWEKNLSRAQSISCGSCHAPDAGYADSNQFSSGDEGQLGTRNSMSLTNIGWAPKFFWDNRANGLEEQILIPIQDHLEMNLTLPEVVKRLQADENYVAKFSAAFGTEEVSEERIAKSIAQFLRTFISNGSKYDRSRLGLEFLNESEQRGLQLFQAEGGDPEQVAGGQNGGDCFHCHTLGGLQFSDYQARNNGLDETFTDLGVGGITGNPSENGKFKTPTLRNVEFTAPYMHDGRFATLEEVMQHYNEGVVASETLDPFIKLPGEGLGLSPQSVEDLINFMKALSDPDFLTNPALSNPHD